MLPIALYLAAEFAPSIIKYFTNSDTAASVASKVIGIAQTVTDKQTPNDAVTAIKEDPELAIKFSAAIMANDADLEKAALLDRQDARKRDVAIVQAGHYNWRADILAVLAVGGLMGCMYMVAKDASLPERSVNAIMFVAGVLAAAVRDVFSFEFGSSRGSQAKDATISNLTK